jgi:thymidylate synthase
MQKGFPILTTKKVAWKQVTSELLWFLTGQTNIAFLHKHNNHIWDGDAYKNYLKETQHEASYTKEQFTNLIKTDEVWAKVWGDLGPIYGKQWRKWDGKNGAIDQIDDLVKELKTNSDSRRLMVSAWNVGELDQMVLPPCHYGFQVYTREENGKRYISLMWNQRSVDTFLGLPFNIASYGLLLHLIANECGMIPDELIGNLGDTHLYLNHIEQAKEQIGRTPYELPILKTDVKIDGICCANPSDFVLDGYQYHPTIKAPLSN